MWTIVEGKQEGGRDPRLGYCATGIRYILRGGTPRGPLDIGGEPVEDINFDTYVGCVRQSEVFPTVLTLVILGADIIARPLMVA